MADTSVDLPDVNVTATPTNTVSPGAPYAQRAITVTIQLGGQAGFSGTSFNTITLEGLRCTVLADKVTSSGGNITAPTAIITVYGMTLDQMNSASSAGLVFYPGNNLVDVQAGDKGQQLVTIFNGLISEAYPDGSNPPDLPFVIIANAGSEIQLKPAKPVSFKGGVSIETALKQIIQPAGLTLENNGVTATLNNPYFPGTVMQQIQSACRAADCFSYIDPIKKVLAIWPKNKSRNSNGGIPVIAPGKMIGYPSFEKNVIKVRTLFDPTFLTNVIDPGQVFEVQSQLKAANGKFSVIVTSYNLSSELPGGPWEMTITGVPA